MAILKIDSLNYRFNTFIVLINAGNIDKAYTN